jgi:hypothetical protein
MNQLPDFIIIGAMKSATSSLYDQLVRQPGIFMTNPKEPNYFSDDEQYHRGIKWYKSLYSDAGENDLLGEASTHYTKLPTYPNTIKRMQECNLKSKFIYVMRHPIDRLVSHYIHEWSQRVINVNIDNAVEMYPEMKAYSLYAMQLQPYLNAYGKDAILPVFFDRLKKYPQLELERICQFINYKGSPKWKFDLPPSNMSSERIRRFPMYNLLIESYIAKSIRRALVPKNLRTKIRHSLSIRKRPELSNDVRKKLVIEFDNDLFRLGQWLGIELNCANFSEITEKYRYEWKI